MQQMWFQIFVRQGLWFWLERHVKFHIVSVSVLCIHASVGWLAGRFLFSVDRTQPRAGSCQSVDRSLVMVDRAITVHVVHTGRPGPGQPGSILVCCKRRSRSFCLSIFALSPLSPLSLQAELLINYTWAKLLSEGSVFVMIHGSNICMPFTFKVCIIFSGAYSCTKHESVRKLKPNFTSCTSRALITGCLQN